MLNFLTISHAQSTEIWAVTAFFEQHIDPQMDGIWSQEFCCPRGIKAAIQREQMIIAKNDLTIVGALRYYVRKSDGVASLYQFAVAPAWRGKGVMHQMLQTIPAKVIHARCHTGVRFNGYYRKTGWICIKEDDKGKVREYNNLLR